MFGPTNHYHQRTIGSFGAIHGNWGNGMGKGYGKGSVSGKIDEMNEVEEEPGQCVEE